MHHYSCDTTVCVCVRRESWRYVELNNWSDTFTWKIFQRVCWLGVYHRHDEPRPSLTFARQRFGKHRRNFLTLTRRSSIFHWRRGKYCTITWKKSAYRKKAETTKNRWGAPVYVQHDLSTKVQAEKTTHERFMSFQVCQTTYDTTVLVSCRSGFGTLQWIFPSKYAKPTRN